MKFIKKMLLSWLGAVPQEKLTAKESECTALKEKLENYEQFAEQCYWYIGSYPAWKAQSEFRELLAELGCPVDLKSKSRAASVDFYLGKVVDACAELREKVPSVKFGDDAELWSNRRLPEARGDNWLAKSVSNAS
ncbi:hypothetical protein [Haliea sp.]|mgnify:CR=1 FL=1|jgi:hypothetical protein|uniref:hypothetical protein n=1 Tax=Haliea sp. TaxID=1932666 RepID=UPI00257E7A55|nr:hypothetical protein [Haliea sp.]|tara:strand:+ start:8205 stop:8609 length:405 start_codon:yes stop_codon:yes gene_type:complete